MMLNYQVNKRPAASPQASGTNQVLLSPRSSSPTLKEEKKPNKLVQKWHEFQQHPNFKQIITIIVLCFVLAVVVTKNRNSRRAELFVEQIEEETVEKGTSIKDVVPDASQRDAVLEATEAIQGFSEHYPVYELESSGKPLLATQEEIETAVQNVDEIVKQEIKEEKMEEVKQQQQQSIRGPEGGDKSSKIVYSDQKEYDAAPYIKVPFPKLMKQGLWWGVKAYEKYYASYPIKWYVPRLAPSVKLTPELFHEHFRRHAKPVIFTKANIEHLGFTTRVWTFDELRQKFPYNETKAMKVVADYKANAVRKDEEEIDLGPGLASIVRDEKLAKQGILRNYPRNLHVKPEALAKLDIQYPPLLLGKTGWQLPTLWLGTSTADTRFHHDCCDNFVLMVAGTKRFTLAPTTDWRTLSPVCSGPNKSLCWANVNDPNASNMLKKSQDVMKLVHKIVVDLKPGEILYMPAGWFHHVKNLGPTVMVNFWTRGKEQCALASSLKTG